jgi:hypothetical protein
MDRLFRWDLARREQLGRLLAKTPPARFPFPEFVEQTREAAARVLAASDDGDLWFVGRSLESVFDYLAGATAQAPPGSVPLLRQINISLRFEQFDDLAFRRLLRACGLAPAGLVAASRRQVLADVVLEGSTMEHLVMGLARWARHEGVDVRQMVRRLKIVGVLRREKTSPNTWRWNQHAEWITELGGPAVENIAVPRTYWRYVGDDQEKVGVFHPRERWNSQLSEEESRAPGRLAALGQAVRIYDLASTAEERHRLTAVLSRHQRMREPWVRALVATIRR